MNASSSADAQSSIKDMLRTIVSVYGVALIFFGLLGNLLCALVIRRDHRYRATTRILFIILACADSLVLIILVGRYWARQTFNWDIRNAAGLPFCLAHVFVAYFIADFAVGTLCLIVCERVLAVLFPVSIRAISTLPNLAKTYALFVFILLSKNVPLFFSHEANNISNISLNESFSCMYVGHFFQYYTIVDMILNCIIPDAILIGCNAVIFISLKRKQPAHLGRKSSSQVRSWRHNVSKTARVVLALSAAHLFLTLPSAIYLILDSIHLTGHKDSAQSTVQHHLLNNALLMLTFTNNGINFFIFLAANQSFRCLLPTIVCPESIHSRSSSVKHSLEQQRRKSLRFDQL